MEEEGGEDCWSYQERRLNNQETVPKQDCSYRDNCTRLLAEQHTMIVYFFLSTGTQAVLAYVFTLMCLRIWFRQVLYTNTLGILTCLPVISYWSPFCKISSLFPLSCASWGGANVYCCCLSVVSQMLWFSDCRQKTRFSFSLISKIFR